MRILMIIPQMFYSTRGTPLSAYHRIRDLVALGHQVEVLTYKGGLPPPDPSLVVHRSKGPHFFDAVRQGPSHAKIWFDALLFCRLCFLLARERYDLLYAHEEGGFLAALLAPTFRVPLVVDMHSSLPLQIRDWKFSDREWVVRIFEWVERFTLKRSVAAIAISPAVADAAHRAAPSTPVEIVVNRFDADAPAGPGERKRVRRELGIEPDERVVLYTGSFVALQSLDLLVAAVPAVALAVPDVRFVLVGGKPDEIAALARLVREAGVDMHVLLLAARPQAEMPAFASAADVLVSPRVQGINPPGKLFSYLSSGRPVVATDRPVHNQILDPRCAILTTPDADGLANGIICALTDAKRVRAVVTGAAEALRDRYHPDQRFDAYRRILARVKGRSPAVSEADPTGATLPPGRARPARGRRLVFIAGCVTGCAASGLVVFLLQSTVIPDWIVTPLQRDDTSGSADAIVVLGADAWEPCGPSLSSVRRTFKGVDLLREGRAPLLVFTGGVTEASRGVPVAGVMGDLARRLGVPDASIFEEKESRNTWENAQLARQLLRPRGVGRVLIVTDSIHMRRAEACFLRAGFEVERASVPQVCVSSSNLAMLRSALHEYVGWLVYRKRGWLAADPTLN